MSRPKKLKDKGSSLTLSAEYLWHVAGPDNSMACELQDENTLTFLGEQRGFAIIELNSSKSPYYHRLGFYFCNYVNQLVTRTHLITF
jgi:hypothetical protein